MQILSHTKLPARLENLGDIIELVSGSARTAEFGAQRISEIELATEEALVNIIHYAYQNSSGDIEITCKLEGGNRFVVEIADTGVPFNVLSAQEPDVTGDISHRKIGGLGIYLMKKLMHEIRYRREGDRNILDIIAVKEAKDV